MLIRQRGILCFSLLAGLLCCQGRLLAQCQLDRFSASDADGGDELGFSVAMTRDYVIVGAPKNDDAGESSGSAYIFRRVGVHWTEKSKLVSPDAAMNDFFGASVAIYGDYAAVAGVLDDEAGLNAGAIYVFHRSGNSWPFEYKIMVPGAAEDDELGTSLALYGDYIVAGARTDAAGLSSGSAFVFLRNGTTWSKQQELTASDAAIGDEFGGSVSISGDYIAVGAGLDNAPASDSGSVYIFKRTGTTWAQQTRIVANDGAMGNEFGRSVSLDGDYLVAGASKVDLPNFNNAGAAYVFKRTNTTWTQQSKVTATDPNGEDLFGVSVGISGDYVVVGSFQDDDGGNNSGSAHVFRRNGTTWVFDAKLTAFDDDPSDLFGYAVAIRASYAAIAAPFVDDFGLSTGTTYMFGVANDCNGNGDPDACDIDSGISRDGNGDGVPDECGMTGGDFDIDNDTDHDFKDFAALQRCFSRGIGMLPGCTDFDGEPDGDVDLDDYFMFQGLLENP